MVGIDRYLIVRQPWIDLQGIKISKFYNSLKIALLFVVTISALGVTNASAQDRVYGLVVEPESRCSPYDRKEQYPYSQSVEDEIVEKMNGKVYGPYTGRYFNSDTQTDIEHIVATSEAHDSGLCAASPAIRAAFANDLLNLTLASPKINRCGQDGKCGLDAGEWLPEKNKCWFTSSVVQVKRKYSLSVDRNEADELIRVLTSCESMDMIFSQKDEQEQQIGYYPDNKDHSDALELYDNNGNGRITCSEARSHRITPVSREHIAYEFMYDKDGDGMVCE